MDKLKIGLIYGGASPEHEVSISTAKSIRENIDRDRFDVVDIFIDKDGKLNENLLDNIDVAFLAVHGPNCEDGKLQQYLEDRKIKYTGSGVKASQINMDKILMHDAFKAAGLPVVEYKGFDKNNIDHIKNYVEEIDCPVFIKPNNGGSSIGMTKVDSIDDLEKAIQEAFKFDDKIIVEKAVVKPREIELAVLGNNDLIISEPGEINYQEEFYDYNAKYFNQDTSVLFDTLDENMNKKIKEMTSKAYLGTGCKGYARVDFLIDKNENIFINEINFRLFYSAFIK